jgi:hypothetical protein
MGVGEAEYIRGKIQPQKKSYAGISVSHSLALAIPIACVTDFHPVNSNSPSGNGSFLCKSVIKLYDDKVGSSVDVLPDF